MKRTPTNNRKKLNDADIRFAKKILGQTIVSIVVFVLLFVNSKLPFKLCADINNTIKYYLTINMDFKKATSITKNYFDNILEHVRTLPASGNTDDNSIKEN